MTKKELIDAVAAAAGTSKKDTAAVVEATLKEIVSSVANGDKVQIVGFGTFEARERGARVGNNPATGKKIKIEATTVPVFKAGAAFKDAVKK